MTKINIQMIIYQLSSIKDNAESFIEDDTPEQGYRKMASDDEIWRNDVKVCEELIAILSEMQDTGIDTTEQVHKMIADHAERMRSEQMGSEGGKENGGS